MTQRATLFEAEKAITVKDCINSKPLFQTIKAVGEENTLKVVMFIIWNYQKSLHLPEDRCMDSFELSVCSNDYLSKYTHDSITDLIFALKTARQEGKVFYNKFSQQDFFEIVNKHFNKKAIELEIENKQTHQSTNAIAIDTLKFIEQAYNHVNNNEEALSKRMMMDKIHKQLDYANSLHEYKDNLPEEIKKQLQEEEINVLNNLETSKR